MRNFLCLAVTLIALPVMAEEPAVEKVTATQSGDGTWRFDVTIRHPDTGWDHYADGWRILDMDGKELGMRVLYHPHVDEQPFTRSLSGVVISETATQVQVQARDHPGGWNSGATVVTIR